MLVLWKEEGHFFFFLAKVKPPLEKIRAEIWGRAECYYYYDCRGFSGGLLLKEGRIFEIT